MSLINDIENENTNEINAIFISQNEIEETAPEFDGNEMPVNMMVLAIKGSIDDFLEHNNSDSPLTHFTYTIDEEDFYINETFSCTLKLKNKNSIQEELKVSIVTNQEENLSQFVEHMKEKPITPSQSSHYIGIYIERTELGNSLATMLANNLQFNLNRQVIFIENLVFDNSSLNYQFLTEGKRIVKNGDDFKLVSKSLIDKELDVDYSYAEFLDHNTVKDLCGDTYTIGVENNLTLL
jgi:hypothetical protein